MNVVTNQVSGVVDQVHYRRIWLENTIETLRVEFLQKGFLDLGAGKKPYEKLVTDNGFKYTSQDFANYSPDSEKSLGLQDDTWPGSGYDIVCDILEVNVTNYDVVLLTEVLEHVLDPTEVLRIAAKSVRSKGIIIISVPFNSRMHQAPYWYSSGLSEFYFKDLAEEIGYECLEITKVGDFIDYWIQETTLCLSPFPRIQFLGTKLIQRIGCFLRNRISADLLSSGGLNLLCVLQKI